MAAPLLCYLTAKTSPFLQMLQATLQQHAVAMILSLGRMHLNQMTGMTILLHHLHHQVQESGPMMEIRPGPKNTTGHRRDDELVVKARAQRQPD
mmetsp:Transcript_46404/g.86707  ORF Transcript_46404/g.86707 Transcript_46404/m.86707 type:complete len:94 (-) Transcript_46404:1576-1857(-)